MTESQHGSNDDEANRQETNGSDWEATARRELHSRFHRERETVGQAYREIADHTFDGEPMDGERFQSVRSELVSADERLIRIADEFGGPTAGDDLADELARLGAELNGRLREIAERRAEGRTMPGGMGSQAVATAVDVIDALEEAGIENEHYADASVTVESSRRPIADGGTRFEWLDGEDLEVK